jgi:hypothetical protein
MKFPVILTNFSVNSHLASNSDGNGEKQVKFLIDKSLAAVTDENLKTVTTKNNFKNLLMV